MKNILEQFSGPWVYKPEEKHRSVYDANGMYIMFADVDPKNADYTAKEDQKARLVAAAPEILQALVSVQEYFFNDGSLFKYKDMLRMIDAAITKVMDTEEKPNNSTVID
jgi:hypothetical protein